MKDNIRGVRPMDGPLIYKQTDAFINYPQFGSLILGYSYWCFYEFDTGRLYTLPIKQNHCEKQS